MPDLITPYNWRLNGRARPRGDPDSTLAYQSNLITRIPITMLTALKPFGLAQSCTRGILFIVKWYFLRYYITRQKCDYNVFKEWQENKVAYFPELAINFKWLKICGTVLTIYYKRFRRRFFLFSLCRWLLFRPIIDRRKSARVIFYRNILIISYEWVITINANNLILNVESWEIKIIIDTFFFHLIITCTSFLVRLSRGSWIQNSFPFNKQNAWNNQ